MSRNEYVEKLEARILRLEAENKKSWTPHAEVASQSTMSARYGRKDWKEVWNAHINGRSWPMHVYCVSNALMRRMHWCPWRSITVHVCLVINMLMSYALVLFFFSGAGCRMQQGSAWRKKWWTLLTNLTYVGRNYEMWSRNCQLLPRHAEPFFLSCDCIHIMEVLM